MVRLQVLAVKVNRRLLRPSGATLDWISFQGFTRVEAPTAAGDGAKAAHHAGDRSCVKTLDTSSAN